MKRIFALFLVLSLLVGIVLPVLAEEDACTHEAIERGSCSDCGEQFIVKNPSIYDPAVQVMNAKNAGFQWYVVDLFTPITDEHAVTAKNSVGDYSAYEDGRWIATRDGVGTEYEESLYFHMELKAGDLIVAYRDNYSLNTDLYLEPVSGYVNPDSTIGVEIGDGIRFMRAEYDGVYALRGETYAEDINTPFYLEDDGDSLLAWHFDSAKIDAYRDPMSVAKPVEGETSYRLNGGEPGKMYFCRVTYKDGTVVDSDAFFFRYAVTSYPSTDDPTIELNSNATATFEWLRLYYEKSEITENAKLETLVLEPILVSEEESSYYLSYYPITLSRGGELAMEFDGNVFDVMICGMDGSDYRDQGFGSSYESEYLDPGSYYVSIQAAKPNVTLTLSAIGTAAFAGNSPYDAERGFLGEAVDEIDFGKDAYRYFTIGGLDPHSNDYSYIVTVSGEHSDVFLYDYRNMVKIPSYSRSGDAYAFHFSTDADAYSLIVLTEDGSAAPTVKAKCIIDDVLYFDLTDKALADKSSYTEAEGWHGAVIEGFDARIYAMIEAYAYEPIIIEINNYEVGMDAELLGGEPVDCVDLGNGRFLFLPEYGGLYSLVIGGAWADTTVRIYHAEAEAEEIPIMKDEIKGVEGASPVGASPAGTYVEGHGWNGRYEEMVGFTTLFTVEVPVAGAVAVEPKEGVYYYFGTLDNEIDSEYVDGKLWFYNYSDAPFVGTLRTWGTYGVEDVGVRAYLCTAKSEALENETGATLKHFDLGGNQGYAFRVTFADGTFESYFLEQYWDDFVNAANPTYNEVIGSHVTYRWYAADELLPLSDANAKPLARDGDKSRYTELLGWEGIYDELYGATLFFEVDLKKGEGIVVYESDMEIMPALYNSTTGFEIDMLYYEDLGAALLIAPEDGTYFLGGSHSLKSFYSQETYYAKAHLLSGFEAIEGETDKTLSRMDANTYYYCVATSYGGETKQSDTFFAEPIITHKPTSSEPYVEVNLTSGVTYQWYEMFGEGEKPLDDTMATPATFGEGEDAGRATYDESVGWTPIYSEKDNYYHFFTVTLRRGESLVIDADTYTLFMYDGKTYHEVDFYGDFTAEKDGTYTLVSPDFVDASVSVTAVLLEGETGAAIAAPELGKGYVAVAYVGDASVSAEFYCSLALTAPVTAASPTVKTNAPADMILTYEWYKDNGVYANVAEDYSYGLSCGYSYNGVFESESTGYDAEFTAQQHKIEFEIYDTTDIDTIYVTIPENYKGEYAVFVNNSYVYMMYGKGAKTIAASSAEITIWLSDPVCGVLIEAGVSDLTPLEGETEATLSAAAMADGGRYLASVFHDGGNFDTFFVKDESDAYAAYLGYTEETDRATIDAAYAEVDFLANASYLVGREDLAVTAAHEHLSDLIAELDKHVHTYGDGYAHNDTHHYKECTDPNCPDKEWSVKDAVPHTHENACDATCDICGATRTPADHVYGEAVVTREATKDADGEHTYTCTVCGAKKTESFAYEASGLGTGAIVAIASGAVAVLGGGGFVLWWFAFRKKSPIGKGV